MTSPPEMEPEIDVCSDDDVDIKQSEKLALTPAETLHSDIHKHKIERTFSFSIEEIMKK